MNIFVTVKQAGKRRGFITNKEIVFDCASASLRELISQIVRLNVDEYNQKRTNNKDQILHYLLPEEIADQVELGKVTFGHRYNEQQADEEKAIATAILAFQDGLFRVFCSENGSTANEAPQELTELDAPLQLTDGSVLTFIRFTMLSGRMW